MPHVHRALLLALLLPVRALAGGDFNGDGFDDAAVAAPLGPVLGAPSGSVSVLYGSSFGFDAVSAPAQQHLTAFHFGLAPNLADEFGDALAIGDFDGDGLADLAIGIPGREVAGVADAGAVAVVYGAIFGLDPDRRQVFTQATKGIKDDPEPRGEQSSLGDEFGCALAPADFNADGRDDLAIGACGEDVGGVENAGAVHVLRGSKKGLRAKKNQLFTRTALAGAADSGWFGSALAPGDFDGDGFSDLAIGAWQTRTGNFTTGAVGVLRGSKKGLDAGSHRELEPVALLGVVPDSYYFGRALAAGDFDANGADDLAVGATGTEVGGQMGAGATHVVYGTPGSGLDPTTVETWDEVSVATGGFEPFDAFGTSLAAGDFDTDGRDDLAIGIPFAEVVGLQSAGEMVVLRGSAGGLVTAGFQLWSQAAQDVLGLEEEDDSFGFALGSGDYDGDGAQDVLVGCPREEVLGLERAGAVVVLYGDEGGSGLTADGNEILSRSDTVAGVAAAEARFGGTIGN